MSTPPPLVIAEGAPRSASLPLVLAALGGVAHGIARAASPTAGWSNLLLAAFALATAGAAGPVFLALYHLTGARWGDGILRVPQSLAGLLPAAAVGMAAVVLGAAALYPWADAARVHADPILAHREGWMSVPLVLVRLALIFGLWIALGGRLVRLSRAALAHPGEATRNAAARAGALFLVLFAPTFSVFCFDTLLSLEPHWPSTIFALLHFVGLFEAGLALIVLRVLHLKRSGALQADVEVLHDLGKLLFAFAFLWGYLWFCQFMLVWYTNLPEETSYYAARHHGAWEPLAVANVLLNWTLPFVLLLSRHGKRSAAVLARVAGLVLVGRWLDLYLAIQPSVAAERGLSLVPLLLAFAMAAGVAGLAVWLWGRSARASHGA